MHQARGPVGIFVLRAWSEGPDQRGLRIRIVSTRDASGGENRTEVATTPSEARRALDRWLEEFQRVALDPRRVTER